MQELTLMLIKLAYLAILWVFVLGAISVIRSDMFGARVEASEPTRREQKSAEKQARKPAKTPRGTPSKVVVVDGPSSGSSAALDNGPVLIGRGTDAAIRLDDDYVSTRHARVVNGENGIYVEDLGSTNGSYVNGQRITAPTTITMSDTVRIGKTILKLEP
jgi:pSer/pThr/pTyr-binding forkhead associated (FHA) protein